MVEFAIVLNQNALRYLLRTGDIFEPQQGMINSSMEPEYDELGSSGLPDHKPWVWRTPKPKAKMTIQSHMNFCPTLTGTFLQTQSRKLLDLWSLHKTLTSATAILP